MVMHFTAASTLQPAEPLEDPLPGDFESEESNLLLETLEMEDLLKAKETKLAQDFDPKALLLSRPSSPLVCHPSRKLRPGMRKLQTRAFLEEHNFKGVNEPGRLPSVFWWRSSETVYPIHVAAKSGDHEALRLLLRAGASFEQKTSSGRTALQIAEQADREGSHSQVIALLKPQVKVLTLREFAEIINSSELSSSLSECKSSLLSLSAFP